MVAQPLPFALSGSRNERRMLQLSDPREVSFRGVTSRMRPIQVLVVEDSPVERELLVRILSTDLDIQVVGTARNGAAALAFLQQQKPDVITMDINMPDMDGYETTRRIMETCPVPIVIVSVSWDSEETTATFRALEAGAVAGVAKPRGLGHSDHEETTQRLIQTVKAMAEVKVVRRWARHRRVQQEPAVSPLAVRPQEEPAEIKLIAVGSSTGGPLVLQVLLSRLRKDFSLPVVIVQHIVPGFLGGLVEWLAQTTGRQVRTAAHGEHLHPGRVYFAPDGFHTGVERDGLIALHKGAPEHGVRPSVSYLFRSVANTLGKQAVGVLLTGMGRDGAEELRLMKQNGAVTIAQDKESSVVYGMPGEAVKLGGATHVLPPERIAATLNGFVERLRAH